MNSDDLERMLAEKPLRQPPPEWRQAILASAHAARGSSLQHAAEQGSLFERLRQPIQDLLWPSPKAWAGLAAMWLVVLALHLGADSGPTYQASPPAMASASMAKVRAQQHKLMVELMDKKPAPHLAGPPPLPTRPRSEGGRSFFQI